MDQNFQTSFIPKKPIIEERSRVKRSVGILLPISIFIFLSMVISAVGVSFYKKIVSKNIVEMEANLNRAKQRFEPDQITKLQVADRRLRASKDILDKHIAVTPIFKALSDITMKSVRYTKFAYDVGTSKESRIIIKLSGQALRYSSVALQSDLFKNNKNLIDPVFSNLALDSKGNVLFDLEFAVEPSFVGYRKTVEDELSALQDTDGFQSQSAQNGAPVGTEINTGPNPFLNQ